MELAGSGAGDEDNGAGPLFFAWVDWEGPSESENARRSCFFGLFLEASSSSGSKDSHFIFKLAHFTQAEDITACA